LACGSVLASATHMGGDGSLAGNSAPLPHRTPVALGAGNPDGYRADAPADRSPAAPELVSAQAADENSHALHPKLGQVRRNNPVSVNTPAQPSRQSSTDQRQSPSPAAGHAPSAIAPVAPMLDPATKGVRRVAPVGGVLTPANPSGEQAGSVRDEPAPSPRAEQTPPSASDPVTSDAVASVRQVVRPVSSAVQPAVEPATQPAMAMLTPLLPKG
jgi:hypothetical protein